MRIFRYFSGQHSPRTANASQRVESLRPRSLNRLAAEATSRVGRTRAPRTRKPFRARRMIVHLGLAKTGSTFLQQALFNSRAELLANHGILFPASGPNHWHFHSAVSTSPERLIQIRREGVTSPDKARAIANAFLDAYAEEVSATKPDTIIVSSEYFAAMSPEELARFARMLSGFADQLVGVVYLRDPWSFSISMMQQLIRDGMISAPFSFGYASGQIEILKRFEQIFGDNLIVRQFLGGSTHARKSSGIFAIIRAHAENDMNYLEQRYFGGARILSDYVNETNYPEFDYSTQLEALTQAELQGVLRACLASVVRKEQGVAAPRKGETRCPSHWLQDWLSLSTVRSVRFLAGVAPTSFS